MKKINLKKIAAFILTGALALTSFTGCSSNGAGTEKNEFKIGVIQYGSHPSLDNCYEGIMQGLQASDIADKLVIDKQDGNFDSATCDTIAKNMAAKSYDMIFAIATPAAISAYAAAANTDIPVIFCAVSDPVKAGLVDDMNAPGGNCTGTSDILDLASQVELITTLQPTATKIGVLYTTSEANSISQLAKLKEVVADKGIEIVEQGVQGAADIPQAAASLASKVDCINNFTDNNVVNSLSVLLEQANAANIPVYGSEIEQVSNGCIASISIDYIALGKVTGEMGVRVLNGEKAGEIAVGQIKEGTPVVNTDVLAQFGIELPEQYASAEQVTTKAQ